MHDSHIHMAMEPLKSNVQEIVRAFLNDAGKYILTQGTDIADFNENFEVTKIANMIESNSMQVAIGLHPIYFEEITLQRGITEDIFEKSQKEIEKFLEIFNKKKETISAIGECGLDYYQFTLNQTYTEDMKEQLKEVQKIMLRKEIQLAIENSLPLSIHARDPMGEHECMNDTIRIIAEEGKGLVKGSFHSFTGTIEQLQQVLDLGFHVGFNAIITYKSGENVREVLKNTPIERILFETDGPFLPPQSVRKDNKIKQKFAQPKDIREIMQVATEVKNISIDELERVTDESYQSLFI
ncbi:MAG TPA: TatD family hydrolase [Candidatus Dojkabacteria bacterium]|jgi:TatD DNase family protein|nr:TatD family hydrolase [Candidatus Dojkabacteria bacterium]